MMPLLHRSAARRGAPWNGGFDTLTTYQHIPLNRAPAGARPDSLDALLRPGMEWFGAQGWTPFDFQIKTWRAYLEGRSGLVHAPTGVGKTLAVAMGPFLEGVEAVRRGGVESKGSDSSSAQRLNAFTPSPLSLLWVTPLRALSADTAVSLRDPIQDLGLPWTVEVRTGDTPQSIKRKQRQRLPAVLIITPESLSLMLSYPESPELFRTLRCIVVDEWHELMGTKRGTQTELALARLRTLAPTVRTWGLSATLGNLDEALAALLPAKHAPHASDTRHSAPGTQRSPPILIHSPLTKRTEIATLLPDEIDLFPWAGHLGLRQLPAVLQAIESARTTLLFTNTRSQSEYWFRAIVRERPDWLGQIALHHGSLDRGLRNRVETLLKAGAVRCVVCTSSLDLGVDFSPVDQVIQVGSPKGIARLMQRAGRSGHQPGAVSRVMCIPTHAFELMEFAAARAAAQGRHIESRPPLAKPLDVLVQHLVTIAAGTGFCEDQLLAEVRSTHAYRDLSDQEWRWAMDFVRRGGPALTAYPNFARVVPAEPASTPSAMPTVHRPPSAVPLPAERLNASSPFFTISSERLARFHRMAIGTISADTAMIVRYARGKSLGSIEESFISRLRPGDRFVFAGRTLELLHVREMTAVVRPAKKKSGAVPIWNGSKMPLSSQLSDAVREKLEGARLGDYSDPEMRAIRPLLELQGRWSIVPTPEQLLVEQVRTRDGHHTFIFPFEGRLVHEGLAPLCALRLSRRSPITVQATSTDYGFDLHSPTPLEIDEAAIASMLTTDNLLHDMLECLNSTQLARRRFRDIARVAGLISQGFPGMPKSNRHLQASSELFFDVFNQFDPGNLLLTQAAREVLEEQLEIKRMRAVLERISKLNITIVRPGRLTPLAFPVFAEVLRATHVTSESWSDRVARMSLALEAEADEQEHAPKTREPSAVNAESRTQRSRRTRMSGGRRSS